MKDFAIVVNSCDKYSWLWDGWYYFFKTNLNLNCNIYLLSESEKFDKDDIKMVNVPVYGFDKFTIKLRESLKQIPEKNILLITEDFYILKKISFNKIYTLFKKLNADSIRLHPFTKRTTSKKTKYTGLNRLSRFSNYLISHCPTIFNKEFLIKCLDKQENLWENEVKGSKRLKKKQIFNRNKLYIYNILWCVNVINKGKITNNWGYDFIKKINN